MIRTEQIFQVKCLFPLFIILFASIILGIAPLYAQQTCTFTAAAAISDNAVTTIPLVVRGDSNVTLPLSHPNQGLCRVAIKFRHDKMQDLTIALKSPSGQIVNLIGPFAPGGGFLRNANALWDVDFVRCEAPAKPYGRTQPTWNSLDAEWGFALGTYYGSYYPTEGCGAGKGLNAFNKGTPVGTWELIITDHFTVDVGQILSVSLEFCEPNGLYCFNCDAVASRINPISPTPTFCQGDNKLSINLKPRFTRPPSINYDYAYVITQGDRIINTQPMNLSITNPQVDLRSFGAGTYQIYGICHYRPSKLTTWMAANNITSLKVLGDSLVQYRPSVCATLSTGSASVTILETFRTPLPPAETCDTQPFEYKNKKYTVSQTIYDTLQAKNGCDSLLFFNLTVHPSVTKRIDTTLCAGQRLIIGNNVYEKPNFYFEEIKLSSRKGCDSTIRLNLIISSLSVQPVYHSMCEGDTLQLAGKKYFKSGLYQDTIKSSDGCLTLVKIDLDVVPKVTTKISKTICEGESYSVGPKSYDATGIYENKLGTLKGCDSTIILDLKVLKSPRVKIDSTICDGDFVDVNKIQYRLPGTYVIRMDAANGCDSILTLTLKVNPNPNSILTRTICRGKGISIGSKTYYASGTYRDTLVAKNKCDSVIMLNLTVADTFMQNMKMSLCEGEVISIGNEIYNKTGIYTKRFASVAGCDSTIRLNLTILPTNLTYIKKEICEGNSVPIAGKIYNKTGIYIDTLKNIYQCDSIIRLDLTVLNSLPINTIKQTLCFGGNIQIGSNIYANSGTYHDTLVSKGGCDSIIITQLTILPLLKSSLSTSICKGKSITIGTQTFTASGVYTVPLKNKLGCDSTVTLNLMVVDTIFTPIKRSICQGKSLSLGGKTFVQAGNYTIPLKSASGCDSIVQLNLEVVTAIKTNINQEICYGSSYIFDGKAITSPGTYAQTYTSAGGCDSIVTLNIKIKPQKLTRLSKSICGNQTVRIGGNIYATTGVYTDTLTAFDGCDSIVQLTLSKVTSFTHNINETICKGGSIALGNKIYTAAGTYLDTLKSKEGCDSIVRLRLSITDCLTGFKATAMDMRCSYDSSGVIILTVPKDTLSGKTFAYNINKLSSLDQRTGVLSVGKRDSVKNLTVGDYQVIFLNNSNLVLNVDTVSIKSPTPIQLKVSQISDYDGYQVSCPNAKDGRIGVTTSGGTSPYTYNWNIGNTGFFIQNLGKGDYYLTVTDKNGCTHSQSFNLKEPPPMQIGLATYPAACIGKNDGKVMVAVLSGGKTPFTYAFNKKPFVTNNSFDGLEAGTYKVEVKDAHGCRVDTMAVVGKKKDLTLQLNGEKEVLFGDKLNLFALLNVPNDSIKTTVWSSNVPACNRCLSVSVIPQKSAGYGLKVTDFNGCVAYAEWDVVVIKESPVYIPNAFSPNEDAINDLFIVYGDKDKVKSIKQLSIYDNWGGLVFERKDFPPNDASFGWDGYYAGRRLNPALFVYKVIAQYNDDREEIFYGEIMLMR